MSKRKSLGKPTNWLQLSDLHVFAEANTHLIMKSFEKLAKKISPHFIIVSGDFRHKKNNPNYEYAKKYLEDIIQIFGVEKENVFLVPGNHDVNNFSRRKDIILEVSENVEKNYACYSRYMDRTVSLHDGFRDYVSFVKSFYDGTKVDDDRIHNPSGVYCITWKNKLNLFHINTALISDGARTHYEIVDVNKITEIARNNIDTRVPTLMIGHHGFNSIYPSQRKILENVLRAYNFSAYLHGDIHVYKNEPIRAAIPNTSFPEIACGKSAPQSDDDFSDVGVIYYSWKEDDNTYVYAYQWIDGEFTRNTNPIFIRNIDEPYYFPMLYEYNTAQSTPKEKETVEQVATKNDLPSKLDGWQKISVTPDSRSKQSLFLKKTEHIDTLALQAYESNSVNLLAQAILSQSDMPSSSRHLCTIFETLVQSNHKYPLAIKGEPGTGKSSLLSLLFLKFLQNQAFQSNSFFALIDLHYYDNLSIQKAKQLLKEKIDEINAAIAGNSKTFIFVDGINEYRRRGNQLQRILLRQMAEWDSLETRFILSIGTISPLEGIPFSCAEELLFRPEKIIHLRALNPGSKEFFALSKKILKFFLLMPRRNKEQNERIDKFISCCKKLDGNKALFRTAVFLAKRFGFYSQEREGLFLQSSGKILLDYYSRLLNSQQLSVLARKTAGFMLGKSSNLPDGYKAIPYKSAAARDFLFAYCYIEALKSNNENDIDYYNCILTPGINRIVVDLLNEKENELAFTEHIIKLFSSAPVKAKSQLVYLLGRVHTEEAKKIAIDFLCGMYSYYRAKINYPRVSADEVLLFRSIGISLIYLGASENRNDFFAMLIYNQKLSAVNRVFHVVYYTMPLGGINNGVSFDDNSICTSENICYMYNFLHHSIENTPQPGRQCVNIITMINLVVQNFCNTNVRIPGLHRVPAGFLDLLNKLAEDFSITDTVVKEYILHVKEYFTEKNIYAKSFEMLYQMKENIRSGWLLEGREIQVSKTPESIADHSWACCLLAQALLTDYPEDCDFMSEADLSLCEKTYNKNTIIQMLLIHDLPEVETGDIPTPQKTSANDAKETEIMKKIGVLGVFPFFGQFRAIADLWEEYHSGSTINALIAQDIDHIEPLVQLYLYRNLLTAKDVHKERDDWIAYANNQLQTDFGRTVFRFVSENLLTDEQFDRHQTS